MSNFFGFQGGSINNGNINKGIDNNVNNNNGNHKSGNKNQDKLNGFMNKFSSALGQLNQAVQDIKDSNINEMELSVTELHSRGVQALDNGNYEKARKMFVAGACKQDPLSMMQLHRMYAEGIGVEKDDTQAWFWARMSGDCGEGRGDYLTGLCYKDGKGVERDLDKAWKYMERAVRRGCSDAVPYYEELTRSHIKTVQSTSQEAKTYSRNQQEAMKLPPEEYFAFCMKVASFEDDNNGKNWLGLCYREGNGTAIDDIASVYWFKKAIEYGNPFGLWNLAHMYACGRGVLVDYHEAVRLAEAAEQKGHTLAGKYAVKLRTIINMSAADLREKASDMKMVGSEAYNNEEPYLATHYNMLSAQKGNALACSQVAVAYRYQQGVKRDYNEALFYHGKTVLLYKAVADGAGITYLLISKMFALGLGVGKNMVTADYYFQKARADYEYAKKYNSVTELMNADMQESRNKGANDYAEGCYAGYNCVPDMAQAMKYYEFCASKNYVPGYNALIKMYHEGYSIPKNDKKAMEYMQMCVKGISSTNNPNLWRMMYQSTVCGLVLRAYNYEQVEFHDVLTAAMAIDLCRKAYRR